MKNAFLLISLCMFISCNEGSSDKHVKETDLVDSSATNTNQDATTIKRPNILLIVADDLGVNDLGLYGSEIRTPNIDKLAAQGVLLNNFHVAPTCSPTRAMLLSGVDSHIAGLGNMAEALPFTPNQIGKPGYEGYLNHKVAVLSEILLDAGYNTYMTGKWHLGLTEETSPAARGFEKSFAMLEGGAGAFSNMLQIMGPKKAKYRENNTIVESLPDDFYSTKFYTERMIEYINSGLNDDKPFFSYLAYTAPHWPLQAPSESIKKQEGRYDAGYEVLRDNRLRALKELGFVDKGIEPYPLSENELPWEELSIEQQKYEARKMEIYAAMIDDLDIYIGKLLDYLKEVNEYNNTFIFFMSDNGPEGHDLTKHRPPGFAEFLQKCCDNSYENMGKPNSYIMYGANWSQASKTPLRMHKGFVSQGGIKVPAIAHFPNSIQQGVISNSFSHVKDVMPTLLEVAGVDVPNKQFREREIASISGKSLLSVLAGDSNIAYTEDDATAWELFGKRAVRKGDWKLLNEPSPYGRRGWQLYNLVTDPTEKNDVSGNNPDKLQELISLWESYKKENGVILPDKIGFY